PLQLLAPHLAGLPATLAPPPSENAATPTLTPTSSTPSPPVSDLSLDAPSRPSTQDSAADKAEEELAHPHERWAAEQLTLDGEDLVTRKISHLQHLLLSEALLVGPLLSAPQPAPSQAPTPAPNTPTTSSSHSSSVGSTAQGSGTPPSSTAAAPAGAHPHTHSRQGAGTISAAVCEGLCSKAGVVGASWLWWALRVTCMHQHVLAGRSATLLARTNALTQQLLASITVKEPSQVGVSPAQSQPPSAAAAGQETGPAPGAGPKDLTKAAAAVAAARGGAATAPTTEQGANCGGATPADSWRHVLLANPALHACMLLEMALGQYSYGFVEHGQKLLNEAGTVLGLQVQLSGALGRRTVFQENAKAQLVVRSSRVRAQQPPIEEPLVTSFGFEPIAQPQAAAAAAGVAVSPGGGGGTEADKVRSRQPTHGMVDESDVFMAPKLVAEDGQVLEPRYSATEQALLLAWATHIRKGSAQDELQLWEMAPYLEAVLSQPRSHMMLQATARLLKARHERTRSRTRERALLHMEQLLEALAAHPAPQGPQSGSDSRGAYGAVRNDVQGENQHASSSRSRDLTNTHLPYAYDCWFPLRVHLRKELAEHYMSMGFVGAALGIYEELQLWDALVVCYRLLNKRGAAEDLLKRRLKVTPDDPVIWCNLGDLYTDDSYYEEAWRRSGCRHARSKRSLGRSALRRKDYAAAAAHFEEALAVNPLNPDAWFSQGYAYLKLGEQRQALRALTNVTQQVPEHAEAWNNVAALWLELGEPKRAYSALGECLRYKRDSWQIWENYAQIAQQAGFHLQATRALAQVMQLSAGTRLHLPVLHQLVQAVEDTQRSSSSSNEGHSHQAADSDEAPGVVAGAEGGGGAEADDLAGFVLDIPATLGQLPWAMGSSPGRNGEDEGEADAALPYPTRSAYQAGVEAAQQRAEEQVRALSGSAAFKSDEARFVEVADASLALARAYLQLYQNATLPQGTMSTVQHASANGSNSNAADQQESAPPASSPAKPSAAAAAAAAAAAITPLAVQPGSIRELAAARMHLRGLLKQCEPVFREHAKWQALSNACAEITAAETDAKSLQQGINYFRQWIILGAVANEHKTRRKKEGEEARVTRGGLQPKTLADRLL
ncbi:hypothetical protein DUNSADRAFT_9601, partial [Dunaliella salina]